MKPIIIYGAGGFAREVLELIRDVNRVKPAWDVIGFIDDEPAHHGLVHNGLAVLGGADWLSTADDKPYAVVGVGSPVVKRKLAHRLEGQVAGFPSLVHPAAVVSPYIQVGQGVIVTAGCILTVNLELGDFAMLNLGCTLGHDVSVGAYATLSPATNVSGYVRIGEGCHIGTGAKLLPGVEVGEWSILGAGAVVAQDLPPNCTAVGVPAKLIKGREPGWHEV